MGLSPTPKEILGMPVTFMDAGRRSDELRQPTVLLSTYDTRSVWVKHHELRAEGVWPPHFLIDEDNILQYVGIDREGTTPGCLQIGVCTFWEPTEGAFDRIRGVLAYISAFHGVPFAWKDMPEPWRTPMEHLSFGFMFALTEEEQREVVRTTVQMGEYLQRRAENLGIDMSRSDWPTRLADVEDNK